MGKDKLFSSFRKHALRLLTLLNLLALAWLWLCCGVSHLPCDGFPRLSLITLSFPIALITNFLFLFFWLLFHLRRIWIPALGIGLCWSFIMDYCPFNWQPSKTPEGIKVISWNTHGMGPEKRRLESTDYLKNSDADIICLQEYYSRGKQIEDFQQEMADRGYEMHNSHFLMLFTRFHILDTDTVRYESRMNHSRWYLLQNGADTIFLINNHLESIGFDPAQKEEYARMIDKHGLDLNKEASRSFLAKIVQAARFRGNQARALKELAAEHAGKHIIVCGDFNDTPISYPYQTLSGVLKNAYRDSGSGFSVSYNEKGFWVRIDHIFFSKEGESHNTHVDSSIDTSDHFPIVSWIDFEQIKQ